MPGLILPFFNGVSSDCVCVLTYGAGTVFTPAGHDGATYPAPTVASYTGMHVFTPRAREGFTFTQSGAMTYPTVAGVPHRAGSATTPTPGPVTYGAATTAGYAAVSGTSYHCC